MHNAKILCVDDDLISLGFLGDVLGEHYDVKVCSHPESAVQRAKEFHPDVILLDYNMPTLSGEALLSVFKSDQRLSDVPIILFTAYANSVDIDGLMSKGIRGLIEKPVDPANLLEQVQYVVDHPEFI